MSKNELDTARRKFLLSSVFGGGWLGLRALATGLPAGLLLNPTAARADDPTCQATKPTYLVYSTSSAGDPSGANVPGTYLSDPRICHPLDAASTPTTFSLGSTQVRAAKQWSTLPPALLARTCFFHHGTYTSGHGDGPVVNKLQGAVKQGEMLTSVFAKNISGCLNTVQTGPVLLHPSPLISFAGGILPYLNPRSLQAVLGAPTGPFGVALQKVRDTHVNQINDLLKARGTAAQRALLDRYALSQTQVRALSQELLSDLGNIKNGDSDVDRNIAASVLLKMNVTSVVVLSIDFGGDNHTDAALTRESQRHGTGVAAIVDLFARLDKYGLKDSVTFAMQNVFGRTFVVNTEDSTAKDGRTHNGNHHCSVFIGPGFRGSVIGGIEYDGKRDFRAQAIDSSSGAGSTLGDVTFDTTLASAGKTLAAGVGLNAPVIDDQITKGKVIRAALA